MIKYAFSFVFLGILGLMAIPEVPPAQKVERVAPRPIDTALDSLYKVTRRSAAITESLKERTDSLNELNHRMIGLMESHDYRVYTYRNPRIKLIYKWRKGTPGHWELINKLLY
jgi:hypothetical protein